MQRNRLFAVLIVAALVVAVFAAGPVRAQNKSFKIGFSNGFVDSEWRTQMLQDAQDVAKFVAQVAGRE